MSVPPVQRGYGGPPCVPSAGRPAVTEFRPSADRRRQLRVQRELEDATREVVVVPAESSRVAACIEAALPSKSIASYVSSRRHHHPQCDEPLHCLLGDSVY